MPISPIVLQRRHAELGRIRLGAKRNGNGAPMKLEQFRFTTHSERYARDLAELYGGQAQPWDNNGVASWEVYSTARSIPVIAVKGGLSQWMETWSGGGCVHRCDGETNVLTGDPCDPKDRDHINAKPTTRLSVMLPELEAIGVWRMESHGWNAAAEIPAVAELAQYVGDLVPANLHLVERRSIKDGKTSRFVVPVLDLQIGTSRLRELVNAKMEGRELEAPGPRPAELEAPAGPDPYAEWVPQVDAADDIEALTAIWNEMRDGHELVGQDSTPSAQREAFVEHFRRRAAAIKAASSPEAGTGEAATSTPAASPPAAEPDADGVVDAELVPDDADQVWAEIVKAAGERGMQLPDLEDDVATFFGGTTAAEASASELAEYLKDLQGRPETLAVPA